MDLMIARSGFRCSAYDGYLPKQIALERRSRLTICTGAIASKLDMGPDGAVNGVYIIDHLAEGTSREYHVKAGREVVLCCGALYSPQLLMLR
jgi:choline dehydrogenase-like flavoprotein